MPAKPCPRCNEPLTVARAPGMELDICRSCGGVHFDHGELAKMAIKRRDELDDVERLVEADESPATPIETRGLACPNCRAQMESYDYAGCSGVILDRCPECFAIWVDDGELQAIQDHLKAGAPAKPAAPVIVSEDHAAEIALMDARVHQSKARTEAILEFTGRLSMKQMRGLPW